MKKYLKIFNLNSGRRKLVKLVMYKSLWKHTWAQNVEVRSNFVISPGVYVSGCIRSDIAWPPLKSIAQQRLTQH